MPSQNVTLTRFAMKASCLLWLTLAIVCTATVSACSGREKTKAPAGTAASTPDAHHTQPVGIDACVQEKYPGCHILDHDTDNGLTEVKISHEGREKILIFDGGQWIRTLWELQRDELPPHIVNALGAAGFAFHDIDDNDNSAVDTQDGRFYAVQAKRRGREGIFIVTDDGNIVQRYTSDTWNDDRLRRDNWAGLHWKDSNDRFDEGNGGRDARHQRPSRHDNGEDRFDEGDDEWT